MRLALAEQNLAKLESDFRAELEKEAADASSEIQLLEAAIAGSQRLIAEFAESALNDGLKRSDTSFEIMRRTRRGLTHVEASESSELVPGDLVRVITTHYEEVIN
jgi:hypothetical protein